MFFDHVGQALRQKQIKTIRYCDNEWTTQIFVRPHFRSNCVEDVNIYLQIHANKQRVYNPLVKQENVIAVMKPLLVSLRLNGPWSIKGPASCAGPELTSSSSAVRSLWCSFFLAKPSPTSRVSIALGQANCNRGSSLHQESELRTQRTWKWLWTGVRLSRRPRGTVLLIPWQKEMICAKARASCRMASYWYLNIWIIKWYLNILPDWNLECHFGFVPRPSFFPVSHFWPTGVIFCWHGRQIGFSNLELGTHKAL